MGMSDTFSTGESTGTGPVVFVGPVSFVGHPHKTRSGTVSGKPGPGPVDTPLYWLHTATRT